MEERLQFLSLFSATALFLTAFGQWEGGMGGGGGWGGMQEDGGSGGYGGGGGGGEGGGGEAGLGYEEMNALNVLKNAMEKRVEANRKLNEQLERTSRELTEAKEELKLTREKIEELETKCEMFGRLKEVLKEKLAELEYIVEESERNNRQQQQGMGGGGGGGGGGGMGGGMGGGGRQQDGGGGGGWGMDAEYDKRRLRLHRRHSPHNQDITPDGSKASKEMPAIAQLSLIPSSTVTVAGLPQSYFNLCAGMEPAIRLKLEQALNQTQKRIEMLKGMEHKISVSLFLAKLF